MASVLALLGKRVRCSCGNSFNTSIYMYLLSSRVADVRVGRVLCGRIDVRREVKYALPQLVASVKQASGGPLGAGDAVERDVGSGGGDGALGLGCNHAGGDSVAVDGVADERIGRVLRGRAVVGRVQITSTLLILYSQEDNVTSDALIRDMHLQLTRYQITDPRQRGRVHVVRVTSVEQASRGPLGAGDAAERHADLDCGGGAFGLAGAQLGGGARGEGDSGAGCSSATTARYTRRRPRETGELRPADGAQSACGDTCRSCVLGFF